MGKGKLVSSSLEGNERVEYSGEAGTSLTHQIWIWFQLKYSSPQILVRKNEVYGRVDRNGAMNASIPSTLAGTLAKLIQLVWLLVTRWTVACQAPLSVGFSRQEYWSGLPFPSPGIFPTQGWNLLSPALAGGFFNTRATWEAHLIKKYGVGRSSGNIILLSIEGFTDYYYF